jgi:predicted DNA-binding transcriptional regulator
MKKYPVTSQSGHEYLVKVVYGEWSYHDVIVKKKWLGCIYVTVWIHSIDRKHPDNIVEEVGNAVRDYEKHFEKKNKFHTNFEKWNGNVE